MLQKSTPRLLALIFTRDEHRGVFVTIPYRIPGSAFAVRTIIVKRSEITGAESYEEKRIRDKADDVTDADRAPGKFQRRFDKRLKYDSVYDVIRIVSQDEDGQGIASNPAEEPEFSGYPGNALLTFTTPSPFQVPSNPSAADLVTQLDPATKAFDAFARFTIRAPLSDSGAVQTFAQAQVPEVVVTISDADGSNIEKISHQLTDAELDHTSVVVTKKGLKPGAAKLWVNNIAWRGNDKRVSTGAALAFTGAGFGTNPNLLTVSFTANSVTEPYNPKALQIKIVITQPAIVQALKLAKIDRKLPADPDANYALNLIEFNLQDDQYHVPKR